MKKVEIFLYNMYFMHGGVMKKNITTIIGIIYCFLFVLILILANTGNLNLNVIMTIPYYDKIGHIIIYGLLSVFIHHFVGRKSVQLIFTIPKGPAFSIILSTLEEFSQTFFSARTFSYQDLFASILGIIIFYHAVKVLENKFVRSV